MPLADQDAGMMDALCKAELKDLCLETTLEEVLDLESEHVVEAHAGLVEHADADETTDERVSFEEALWVLGVELEQLTGGTSDFGEREGDAPDLALVPQAVLTRELCAM
jgi:hypothetical protein